MIDAIEPRARRTLLRRSATAGLIAAATLLTACGDEPEATTGSAERMVHAAGLAWRLTLPNNAVVKEDDGTAFIDLAPGRRRPLAIRLGPPELQQEDYASESALPDGGLLAYDVSLSDGGSGGPEAFLDGLWLRGEASLSVSCWAQSENPPPRPDWCLDILASLASDGDVEAVK